MNPIITSSTGNVAASGLTIDGFPPGEDHDKIDVLRYLPLDRFLSLLEFEAMWFSRLGALQDKFECTNPEGPRAFVLKLAEDPEAVEKCKSLGLWNHMLAAADNFRSGDGGRNMFAVNCWFLGKSESEKMWKEYADSGKGIAIRSTVSRLATALQITGDYRLISKVGRINYVDFKSHKIGDRANDVAKVAFIKDSAYAEENEVRILTLNSFHHGCLNPDGTQAGGP